MDLGKKDPVKANNPGPSRWTEQWRTNRLHTARLF
jgi:hypothetical protein